ATITAWVCTRFSALRAAVEVTMASTAETAAAITTIVTMSSTRVTPRQRAGIDMAARLLRHRHESAERIDVKCQRRGSSRWCAVHAYLDGIAIRYGTDDPSVGTE